MPEIIHTNWGIAYAYSNVIEINRKLLKYPKLYNQILQHEKDHLKRPSFRETLRIEFKDLLNFKKQKLLSKILRKHPMMGLQAAMPIWIQNKQICFNSFLLLAYSLVSIPFIVALFMI